MHGTELLAKLADRSDDPTSLKAIPAPQVYTVRQVAGLLGLNLGITNELIRKGEIPAKRLGRRWLIPRDSFHTAGPGDTDEPDDGDPGTAGLPVPMS